MNACLRISILISLTVLAFFATRSIAAVRQASLDSSSSPTWPVMYVDFCREQYHVEFPAALGFDVGGIFNQLNAALHEWFQGAGADFRLRYGRDLPLSDCKTESHIAGRFKARALRAHGGAPCGGFWGAGFDGCNGNTQCSPTGALAGGWFEVFSGHFEDVIDPNTGQKVCSAYLSEPEQVFSRINWSPHAGRGSTAGGGDFQGMFLHEVGHAFGFGHEESPPMRNYNVMRGSANRDNIAIDDAIGLRSEIGHIKLSPQISEISVSGSGLVSILASSAYFDAENLSHFEIAEAPSHWRQFYEPPVLASVYSDSRTAEVVRQKAGAGASPVSSQVVPIGYARPLRTFRSPAYASRPEGSSGGPNYYTVEVIAVQEAHDDRGNMTYSHNLKTFYSYDGRTWEIGTSLDSATTMEPVLVYKHEANVFLLFWVEAVTLKIKAAASVDGITFVPVALNNPTGWPLETGQAFGLDCHNLSAECLLVYSDAARHGDVIKVAILEVVYDSVAGQWVVNVLANDDLLTSDRTHWHSYGVDVSYAPGTPYFVIAYRDRGRASTLQMATFEVSVAPGTPRIAVDHRVFWTIHQTPRVARRGSNVYLSTHYNARYDQ